MSDDGDKTFKGLGDEEWFGDAEMESDVFYGRSPVARADRRTSPRQRVQIEAHVDPGGRKCTVHDISAIGVLLYLDVPLPVASQVEVTLATEFGPATAKGIVRWASRGGHDLSVNRIGMGVQFTWVSDELKRFLDQVFREPAEGLSIPGPDDETP